MEKAIPACVQLIKNCNDPKQGDEDCSKVIFVSQRSFTKTRNLPLNRACALEAFNKCNVNLVDVVTETGVNVYDLREKCHNPPLCGDFKHVRQYLQSELVTKKLGVKQVRVRVRVKV